jgi:demethylmenaquinone methyltransferase / 2-methoxy-6-polyprenyl-1,4-benzoquinol methylase
MPDTENQAPKKPEQVRELFDRIAPRYELNDRLFSLGIDAWWRRVVARDLQPTVDGPLLDGATGSAQLAMALARWHPLREVVGLDFSPGMLAVGRRNLIEKGLDSRISLVEGDLLDLPFAENRFAAATVAFGVRNVADRKKALNEFARVLKSGGRLFVLEFSWPSLPVIAPLYRWYFGKVMPVVARLLGAGEAFAYLHASVEAFPSQKRFVAMLRETGFGRVRARRLTLGVATLYSGELPGA